MCINGLYLPQSEGDVAASTLPFLQRADKAANLVYEVEAGSPQHSDGVLEEGLGCQRAQCSLIRSVRDDYSGKGDGRWMCWATVGSYGNHDLDSQSVSRSIVRSFRYTR
ncbi:hypothetical protein GJ744_001388 [Endocarpon pusillum]|uniref:Uncharacterized protein n=1 Tax=Endocarpon pusillum TaxID=364733 RepID=A0A8H7ANN0_9EURO|nr:hypothetical protein GJ744_001388 [Endocarpon pusillum]